MTPSPPNGQTSVNIHSYFPYYPQPATHESLEAPSLHPFHHPCTAETQSIHTHVQQSCRTYVQ